MSDAFEVTHALAIKRFATADAVAELLGQSPAEVTTALNELASGGKAISAKGAFMLSPAAGKELEASYAERFADLRRNDGVSSTYERFEIVNKELKQLVTDWQTMEVAGEKVPNDHSNADYDANCIGKLGDLHERATVVLSAFEAEIPRIRTYLKRLDNALDQVEGGNKDYFSAPKIASYHTVWFEMHEDLLRLLGRTRSE